MRSVHCNVMIGVVLFVRLFFLFSLVAVLLALLLSRVCIFTLFLSFLYYLGRIHYRIRVSWQKTTPATAT